MANIDELVVFASLQQVLIDQESQLVFSFMVIETFRNASQLCLSYTISIIFEESVRMA